MSDAIDLGLDLETLFQPAWAQGKPEANRFEKFTGDEGVKPERRRGERRGGPSPRPRREGPGGEFPGESRGPRPPRAGGKFGDRKRGPSRREDPRERADREPPAPLPDVSVAFLPDDKGVESIARQIKMTGRAYPLFDIARLILEKPERYSVRLGVKKKEDGAVAQPVFVCALDDSPWLSEDEAVEHVLKNHFATFYQTDRTATEPPKGKYTFVAQCGMSGVILGPPNYHDYQNQLRKLHAERFGRMPFDAFKARVKIVKDEAVVNKWVEEQSFRIEYTVLNVPEPLKLPSLEEVGKHFRATHKEAIIKSVESYKVGGVPSRKLRCGGLYRAIRTEWEQQRRFPLQLSTELSRQFAGHSLQFFKVNKTVVHVSVARPQFLDLETTPVSESIKRIIGFINANPRCTRRKLIETLAPSPKAAETKPEEQKSAEPTPEQNALIADLHWLIHQGHVLEFADGRLENAKKPILRPPKPEKKPAAEKSAVTGETVSATESSQKTGAPAEPVAEVPATSEIQTSPETVFGPEAEVEKPVAEIPAAVEPAASAAEAAQSDEVSSPS
jgi:hypothetical protein